MARAGPGGRSHRPDLGYVGSGGGRVAIEVELSLKSSARLQAIMSGYEDRLYAEELAGVVYVVGPPAIRTAIGRAAAAARIEKGHLRILPLDSLIKKTRALASKPAA